MPMSPEVATARARIRNRQRVLSTIALIFIVALIVGGSIIKWHLLDMFPWYGRCLVILFLWLSPVLVFCSRLSEKLSEPYGSS